MTVFPAVGYIEMAIAAVSHLPGGQGITLEQLKIHKPLILGKTTTRLQTQLSLDDHIFQIHGQLLDGSSMWTLYATGQVERLRHVHPPQPLDLDEIRKRCQQEISQRDFYQNCQLQGFHYGPSFQHVERIYLGQQEAVSVVYVSEETEETFSEYHFHPSLLDSCLQVVVALLSKYRDASLTYLPVEIQRLRIHQQIEPNTHLYCYGRMVKQALHSMTFDCFLVNDAGQMIADIAGVRFQGADFTSAFEQANEYLYEEQWLASPLYSCQYGARTYPSVEDFVTQLQPTIEQIRQELALDRYYQEVLPLQNQLCSAYMLMALRQLGWDGSPWRACFLRDAGGTAGSRSSL